MGAHTYMEDDGDFERLPASAVKLWEHHLPIAAATGLVRTAVRQLSLGAEDARHAWSRLTGTWHPVTVHHMKFRSGWGDHPLAAIFGGLIQGAIAGAVVYGAMLVARGEVDATADLELDVEVAVGRAAIVVATLPMPVALWSLVKVVSGVIDTPAWLSRTETTGIVLRKRATSRPVTGRGVRRSGRSARARTSTALAGRPSANTATTWGSTPARVGSCGRGR